MYWPSEKDPVKKFECEDLKFIIELKSNTDEQYFSRRELEITEYKVNIKFLIHYFLKRKKSFFFILVW